MGRSTLHAALACTLAWTVTACDDATTLPDGPRLAVDVAALNLQGVGDVVWDLEVDNGDGDVIWQRRVTSSGYGDGAGSASYVGTCDADPDVDDNTVKVWVVGVYAAAVTDAGSFASGADAGAGAVTGTPVDFENPTEAGPLTRDVTCVENADVFVQFDVALMRPAQQGFFDIAINFNNVFCSAKLDCCYDDDDDGCEAGEDITLLFDSGGQRARTFVLGFACTAGVSSDVATALHMDPIQLDCDVNSDAATFIPDVTIDPGAAGVGNLCTAGQVASCDAVRTQGSADPDAYLFQAAVYRGVEALTSGGVAAIKVYWNVALGVTSGISACRLRTAATADDGDDPNDGVDGGVIVAGDVYPFVAWDVDLATCAEEPLTFGTAATVAATYTGTSDPALSFVYGFGENVAAGCNGACPEEVPGAMVLMADACPAGWTDLGSGGIGPNLATCGGASCRVCESPSASLVPASATFVVDACPTGWAQVGETGPGPGGVGCPSGQCKRCQSPATASEVPLGAVFVGGACPSGWVTLDHVGTGSGSALCPSTSCRFCRAP